MKPERAHYFTVGLLKFSLKVPGVQSLFSACFKVKESGLERKVFGITFPNPVGLAAGFDKDAKYFNEMAAVGFGFIEIGTVTPKAQSGNPKPRLFRLPSDEALINRMGFNNSGVEAMVERLKKRKPNSPIIIGGNIGKNKVTPNAEAINDYEISFNALFPYVDYFAVNVSSPNTPGLRELQEKEPLQALLQHLQNLNQGKSEPKPILLKIAPDLSTSQLDEIIEIVESTNLAGIIATNTTISREGLQKAVDEKGGLSGKPLNQKSTQVIRYIADKTNGKLPIIGVGGIHDAASALEKLRAGAALVQIYTGMVYQGPSLVKKINKAILAEN